MTQLQQDNTKGIIEYIGLMFVKHWFLFLILKRKISSINSQGNYRIYTVHILSYILLYQQSLVHRNASISVVDLQR